MKWLLLIISHLFLAALFTTIGHSMNIWPLLPIAFIPFLVINSLKNSFYTTLIWALLLGYFLDRLTLAPTGFYMIILTWNGAIIQLMCSLANIPERLAISLFSFVFQLLAMLSAHIIMALSGLNLAYPTTISATIFPELLLAAILAQLLYPWYNFILGLSSKRQSLEDRSDVFIG